MAVFVDDQGGVRQIMNQDICHSHMGKHVEMKAVPEKPGIIPIVHEREMWLRIEYLHDVSPNH